MQDTSAQDVMDSVPALDNNVDTGELQPAGESPDPKTVLEELAARMGFEVTVEALDQQGDLTLSFSGPDAAEIAGKKGQTLDALQYLVNKIARRERPADHPVTVDSDGYRQRRQEALMEMARQLSQKAQQTGKTVAINPMSAHDRRVIHMALKEDSQVETRSEGDGSNRRLLIVPVR